MELILVAEDTYLLKTFSRLEFNPQFVFKRLTDFLKFRFPFIKHHILFVDIRLIPDESLAKLQTFLKTFSLKVILIVEEVPLSPAVRDFAVNHCWGIIPRKQLEVSLRENTSLTKMIAESQRNLQLLPQKAFSLVSYCFPQNNLQRINLELSDSPESELEKIRFAVRKKSFALEKQTQKLIASESKLMYKISLLSKTISDLRKQVKYLRYSIIFLGSSCITLLIKMFF